MDKRKLLALHLPVLIAASLIAWQQPAVAMKESNISGKYIYEGNELSIANSTKDDFDFRLTGYWAKGRPNEHIGSVEGKAKRIPAGTALYNQCVSGNCNDESDDSYGNCVIEFKFSPGICVVNSRSSKEGRTDEEACALGANVHLSGTYRLAAAKRTRSNPARHRIEQSQASRHL